MSAASPTLNVPQQPTESGLRYVVESLVALAVAVLLVRAFAVEGYIISTGSMAPFLLGFHKQVVCPECQFSFAVGVPVDGGAETNGPVACPNCGQNKIYLGDVPRNEGDQLLVQKFAYLLRPPKRWEVVVFQNPRQPTQAYVKRMIGLPREAVQIKAGDVWINGELARKDLAEQRSVRIPICSQKHRAQGTLKDTRWQIEPGWELTSQGFDFFPNSRSVSADSSRDESPVSDADDSASSPLSWVSYRGRPAEMEPTISKGDVLLASASSPTAPKPRWPLDDYAYNGLTDLATWYVVRDLMMSMELEIHSGRGDFCWTITDGWRVLKVQLAADSRELRLFVDDAVEPIQTAKISADLWRKPWLVELSTFDRQLLFALNGETVFVQNLNGSGTDRATRSVESGQPLIRFGASDLRASVRDVVLYRDVYYTRGDERHGIKEPYVLGADEYFFLGDNSPVSLDSRSWADAVVHSDMLIGKPFLVHLPSRPGRIKLGAAEWHVRVPDCDRMRYIR